MFKLRFEPDSGLKLLPGHQGDPRTGLVPILVVESQHLTDYLGMEFHSEGPDGQPQRLFPARRYFEDYVSLRAYLAGLESDFRESLDTRGASASDGLETYRDIVWRLDSAERIWSQLALMPGMNLLNVGVLDVDRPAHPPLSIPNGKRTAFVMPGGAFWIHVEVDFGETLPPLFASSSLPTVQMRRFDLRMSMGSNSSALTVQCLLVDDFAKGWPSSETDTESVDRDAFPLPIFNRLRSFESVLGELGAGSMADLVRITGRLPASVEEFLGVHVNDELRTISLQLQINMIGNHVTQSDLERFFIALRDLSDWAQRT